MINYFFDMSGIVIQNILNYYQIRNLLISKKIFKKIKYPPYKNTISHKNIFFIKQTPIILQ